MRLEVHTHSYPYCLVAGKKDGTVNLHIYPIDHAPDLIKEGNSPILVDHRVSNVAFEFDNLNLVETELRNLMEKFAERQEKLKKELKEAKEVQDIQAVEALILQNKKASAELFDTMERLNILDEEEEEKLWGAIKRRELKP